MMSYLKMKEIEEEKQKKPSINFPMVGDLFVGTLAMTIMFDIKPALVFLLIALIIVRKELFD